MLNHVHDISPNLGCDPEFFFRMEGQVVGAEKFIPKEGLAHKISGDKHDSRFIIDGVQAELNPRPNTCRANLANEIKACFRVLKKEMDTKGAGITVDFSRTVEISKENLMELDEKSRKFGCAPSKTIYSDKAGCKIASIDASEYRVRAAGGHIHIGKGGDGLIRATVHNCEKTVQMLDIICGNTCVLMDRDVGNIERRKLYGKAGEYRLPEHGLEYRTLSNFWLTSYPLMSFAFGMARLAVQLMSDTRHEDYYQAFTSKVKQKHIHDAINENDFERAMKNFKAIEPLLIEVTPNENERYPISGSNMKEFYHFIETIQTKGLTYWFPDDVMKHWTTLRECHTGGFYDFLRVTVRKDMEKNAVPANKKIKAA